MDTTFFQPSAAPGGPAATQAVTPATPTAGQTVAFGGNSFDQTLYLTPAGVLATLTVTLPSAATSRIGQIVRLVSTQTLTLLTVNGAGTILNTITTLAGNSAASFMKVANDTWVRL